MEKKIDFIDVNDTICISIAVTSRCNLKCSYCHYIERTPPKILNYDIQDIVFDRYLEFIKWFKANVHSNIQIRFSGGEPLVLGKRLFELSEKVQRQLNQSVHVLSNGMLISRDVIKNASQSGISAFLISIENPFDVDNGSVDTQIVIDNIISYDSEEVRTFPAAVIVRNNYFHRLSELADFFYEKIKKVPTFTELNFASYRSPSKSQLLQLKKEMSKVVKKYIDKTPLVLFPYIVPELAYRFEKKYLIEFGVAPSRYNFFHNSNQNIFAESIKYLNDAYPLSGCNNMECEWFDYCTRVKWVWLNKMNEYCGLKKSISEGYCDAIL